MNLNLLKRERDLLDVFHLLITIAIAIGGFFINQKQAELNRKIEREKATQTFTDKVFEHLENLALNDDEKEAMVIDLLDIITESNISRTGELSDAERRQLMPLRMALFTENHEILTHIGADSSKRDLWVNFAERSGNAKVKMTAIRALENLGSFGHGERDLMFCLKRILSLGQGLKDPNGYLLANTSLANLVLSMDLEPTRALIQSSQADSLTIVNIYNFLFEGSSSLETIRYERNIPASLDTVREASDQLADLLGLPRGSEYTLTEETVEIVEGVDPHLISNIDSLTSDNSSRRKMARIALAGYGSDAVDTLMDSLNSSREEYQVRLGVATTLNLMQQPVFIEDPNHVRTIVSLLGDPKAEIRKEAAQFLAKLTDRQTIKVVFEELKRVIAEKSNSNGLYNAIIVLISWYSHLDATKIDKEEIRTFMKSERDKLAATGRWSKTVRQIDISF